MACSKTCSSEFVRKALEFDYLRFVTHDINGIARGTSVPRRHLMEFLADGGPALNPVMMVVGPRSEAETGRMLETRMHGSVFLVPAEDTSHHLPWAGGEGRRVGEVICEPHWQDGTPQTECTRLLARKMWEKVRQLGLDLKVSFDADFLLFSKDSCGNISWQNNGKFDLVREEMQIMKSQLNDAGISLESIQVNTSASTLKSRSLSSHGIESADTFARMKQSLWETFKSLDLRPTFMTVPFENAPPNTTSFSYIFYIEKSMVDLNRYGSIDLSLIPTYINYWIAGLIEHAPSVTVLCNPTFNCYRKQFAPTTSETQSKATWIAGSDSNHYINVIVDSENRLCIRCNFLSSACNPYLAMAGHLAAGLDGMRRQRPCPPPGNIDPGQPHLPRSLEAALASLEADETICKELGPEVVDWFAYVKRTYEIKRFGDHNIKTATTDELVLERKSYLQYI